MSTHARGPFELQIRRAGAAEAPAIAGLLAAAFAEYAAAYTPAARAATTPPSARIADRMREGPVWVAEQDGTLVGTVSAVPRGEAVYVRGMAVLPAARGQGAGARLLGAAEQFARENGARALILSTTPFLSGAIRLYEQAGFRRSDAGPHDLYGTPLVTMVKPVPPAA